LRRYVSVLSVLAIFAVALLAAGCGKTGEKPAAMPAAAAPAVDISTLPDYLRYPGATAVERMALNTEDSKGTSWTLVSADPGPRIEEWYQASVEKAGWVKDPEGGKVGLLEWMKPDKTEVIKMMVYEKDGKSNISITQALNLKP
jgi:nitrous oxide reductase accessory protein NosL